MKHKIVFNFLFQVIICFYICSQVKAENNNDIDTLKMNENKKDMNASNISENRKYKFPSIMIKEDWILPKGDTEALRGSLITNNWDLIHDSYGRMCQFPSPDLTYAELQSTLNFNDEDVTYIKEPKTGEPQACIKTDWLTCNITFKDKIYDGKDKSVKLTAIVIDNEVQKKSDEHAEHDKNKGIIGTIEDLFTDKAHVKNDKS